MIPVNMQPIQACEDKERASNPWWPERAFEALLIAGRRLGKFTIEQARGEAYRLRLVEELHDERAWGAVILRASRGRFIVQNGFARASRSNGSIKPMWEIAKSKGVKEKRNEVQERLF